MRVNPRTPEEREHYLAYQRQYHRVRRQREEEAKAKKLEDRRRIAAAIILAEMQESNG
jgi:hypothetical protein